jgi:hypothetical protein
MTIEAKAQSLLKRAQSLKSQRFNFETEWQNVADIFRPIRSNITVTRTKGDKTHIRKLYDSFPITQVETLASILNGTFSNKASLWFQLQTLDDELNQQEEVSKTLSEITKVIFSKLYNPLSNFEVALLEAYKDIVAFGTIGTFIEESRNFDFNCNTLNIRDFLISENKEGIVDYVIIKSKKTARQIVQQWGNGVGNIPKDIMKANDVDPFKEFDLQLHIFPREDRDQNKIDVLNKPIAGVWIAEENTMIIQETGWDAMPIAVGRSEKATNEIYGTSRAMIALADGRQVNEIWRQLHEAGELSLRPPLNVNANYNRRINLTSAALNYPDRKQLSTNRAAIEPIFTIGNIPINVQMLEKKYENIREVFFLDKLKIFDNPNATATQVLELKAESFRIMSPFSVGLQTYLESILNRVFDILFRKSYKVNDLSNGGSSFDLLPNAPFPELPDQLKESPELKVTFVNPINQAQQLTEINSIDSWLLGIGQMAQLKPEVLDLVNADNIARKKREILNIDPDLINDERTVAQTREAKQQALQQQQEQAQAAQLVDGAAKAANADLI